ncbi:MAG: formate/nitrite transporter family protein [Eggerthellaceae bacterium]
MSFEELKAAMPKSDALAPAEIEAKAESLGVAKTSMSFKQSFVLSIMAGSFIALGAMFFILVSGDPGLPFAVQRVLGGALFSLGLLLVVVCGAELFTGNTMIVMTAASKKISWGAVLKNWVIVFFGNFVGALIIVALVYLSGVHTMNVGIVGNTMVSVAAGKMTPDWITLFAKGIMCNFLVCLAVWIAYASKTVADKTLGILLPIAAFVACGFEHCVANMFFLPMGILLVSVGIVPAGIDPSVLNWGAALWNWSATVPGNIVGGALFVGMAYWVAYHKKSQ